MRGLGILGAATPPHPSSRALRTPVSSIFPSYWSEGGDGGSKSLADLSMAAARGHAALGVMTWQLGVSEGVQLPLWYWIV